MNDQRNKRNIRTGRLLPFVVEFVKFSAAFAIIVAAALVALRATSAAMQ